MFVGKIEKEYKMLLTKKQFEKIKKGYSFDKKNIQINHYFNSLNNFKRNYAVRIRELNDKYIFTLKMNNENGKLEYEFEIDNLDIHHKKIEDLLQELNIDDKFYPIGTMKTIRYILNDEFGELCLDENHYFDKIDYEIEYELFDYTQNKLEHFKNILKTFDIEFVLNKKSKLKRFKDELNKVG